MVTDNIRPVRQGTPRSRELGLREEQPVPAHNLALNMGCRQRRLGAAQNDERRVERRCAITGVRARTC